VENRSSHTVTLTSATHKPIRPPGILTLVATQLRLEPRPHGMGLGGNITYFRRWSAARTQPVTIPAGRRAIVQSNFRMGRCNALAGGHWLIVPGEVVLKYRAGGTTGSQTAVVPESRVVLTQGAAQHSCGPRIKGGSSNVVATNISCRVARKTAAACQQVGTCTSDRRLWDCMGGGCWLERNPTRWFVVHLLRGP
jgi:hypothetical protein